MHFANRELTANVEELQRLWSASVRVQLITDALQRTCCRANQHTKRLIAEVRA